MDILSKVADVAMVLTIIILIFHVRDLNRRVSKIEYTVYPTLRNTRKQP